MVGQFVVGLGLLVEGEDDAVVHLDQRLLELLHVVALVLAVCVREGVLE